MVGPGQGQLFGTTTAPANPSQPPANQGFVKDFADTLAWQAREGRTIIPGTTASDIMGCFTPEALPVLSGLARGYAVCDHWYSPAPTETLPNRAFACAATSQGHMDDKTHTFTSPSIFGLLESHQLSWAIYGYDTQPLTKSTFTDIAGVPASRFGLFQDFTAAAAAGSLPVFPFLEPNWGLTGNSQHPNYDVALGEQLIHDMYDDPLAGITVPAAAGPGPAAGESSHLQQVQAELVSRQSPAGQSAVPGVAAHVAASDADLATYIRTHTVPPAR